MGLRTFSFSFLIAFVSGLPERIVFFDYIRDKSKAIAPSVAFYGNQQSRLKIDEHARLFRVDTDLIYFGNGRFPLYEKAVNIIHEYETSEFNIYQYPLVEGLVAVPGSDVDCFPQVPYYDPAEHIRFCTLQSFVVGNRNAIVRSSESEKIVCARHFCVSIQHGETVLHLSGKTNHPDVKCRFSDENDCVAVLPYESLKSLVNSFPTLKPQVDSSLEFTRNYVYCEYTSWPKGFTCGGIKQLNYKNEKVYFLRQKANNENEFYIHFVNQEDEFEVVQVRPYFPIGSKIGYLPTILRIPEKAQVTIAPTSDSARINLDELSVRHIGSAVADFNSQVISLIVAEKSKEAELSNICRISFPFIKNEQVKRASINMEYDANRRRVDDYAGLFSKVLRAKNNWDWIARFSFEDKREGDDIYLKLSISKYSPKTITYLNSSSYKALQQLPGSHWNSYRNSFEVNSDMSPATLFFKTLFRVPSVKPELNPTASPDSVEFTVTR